MKTMTDIHKNTELRKLPCGILSPIIDILEINSDWKKFMSKIPRHLHETQSDPKYNSEHIRLIEGHSLLSGRKCTAILLEEWGTSGKVRPTLSILKDMLLKCEMYRAADEVALILKEPPPQRPSDGPAASIDTDVSMLLNDESMEQHLDAMDSIHNIGDTTGANTYGNMNNKTTAQMKSKTDFMMFSAGNIPNISIFTPSEKVAQKMPVSDFIKFSQTQDVLKSAELPNISALTNKAVRNSSSKEQSEVKFSEGSIILSTDMPKVSALMTHIDSSQYGDTPSVVTTDSTIKSSENYNNVSTYQTTFPNIDLPSTSEKNNKTDESIFNNKNLINFKYEELQSITNNFSDQVIVGPTGITGKIGMGGFGEVFVGVHSQLGTLAVKKAHSELLTLHRRESTITLFNAEVKYLSKFRHNNIVPILGFSRDGPAPCIVCEFIDGGSLERKISAKVLNEKERIDIMRGTAEGLKYLHKSELYSESDSQMDNVKRNNFVHGDIKSANILLTKDCIPKLCDFGLVKQSTDTTFMTTSPVGTLAYMAPESFSGTITQKIDIYSFGIVILEMLTGLKSIVINNKEQINIKDYVDENEVDGSISNLLDNVVANWRKAEEIYDLAKSCLARNRKNRLDIEDVCNKLHEISL